MANSPLQRQPGKLVNRISPQGWAAPEGRYVWCLGSDEAGWTGRFSVDSAVHIQQTGEYGAARLIRIRVRLRGPLTEDAAGWRWEAYAQLDGAELWYFPLEPGKVVDLEDVAIPTQGVSATATLLFGLRVVPPEEGMVLAEPVELEIPAVYLDNIVLDSATDGLQLHNRYPPPGAVDVQQDSAVRVDVVDTEGGLPSLGATRIYLQGALAYEAGASKPGYSVLVLSPAPAIRRFVITAPDPFASEELVEVRVVSASGARSLDATYSFRAEDLTPPSLVAVQSRTLETVRFTFSEAVEGALLTPGSYGFERLSSPAVTVEAKSVTRVSSTECEVELNWPITRGARYRVTVSGVADTKGNLLVAPYNALEFIGYQPAVPARRRFRIWDMVPALNREEDVSGDLRRFLEVIQEVVDLLLYDIDRWTDILDVDVAPERYLDQMLIQLGNPFPFRLTVAEKRRLIRVLVQVYRQKGTGVGMRNAIRFFLGLEVSLRPYAGTGWRMGRSNLGNGTRLGTGVKRARYSFEVVSGVKLSDVERERIAIIVDYMKPPHLHHVRTVEPVDPAVINHLALGRSRLSRNWKLH